MIKALVVDDVKAVRDALIYYLKKYPSELSIVGEADSVKSGVEAVSRFMPDVIFLDVEMKDGTGFDLLKQIDLQKHKIIFVTAFDHYAVMAFKFSAVDYLVKPVDPDELKTALQKLKDVVKKEMLEIQLNTLLTNIQAKENKEQKIVLKTLNNIYSLYIKDIVRCEADNNYTYFHLSDKRKIFVSVTLKEYESLLKEHSFFRVHQSHLINLNYFERLSRKDGNTIVMKDASLIPLASRRKHEFILSIEARKK